MPTRKSRTSAATAPIRFALDGEIVSIDSSTRPAPFCSSCARTSAAPAPRKAAPKATAAPARSSSASSTATAVRFRADQRLHPVRAHARRQGALHGREPERRRRHAAPGPAGDGRLPRLAVRLLHARLRDVAVRAVQVARRSRRGARSTTRSPATSAAAPAIGRSSTPRSGCTSSAATRSPRRALDELLVLVARRHAAVVRRARDDRATALDPAPRHARGRSVGQTLLRAARRSPSSRRCARRIRTRASRRRHRRRPLGHQAAARPRRRSSTPATSPSFARIAVDRHDASTSAPRRRSPTRSPRSSATTRRSTKLARRFASPPIRNAGTLGGNIANGSPIGDSMPALIALGTTLVLRRGERTRELPLDDLLSSPTRRRRWRPASSSSASASRCRAPDAHVRSYKISKRFDQDISAVCGGFAHRRSTDGVVREARVAYGGVAATPKRAAALRAARSRQAVDRGRRCAPRWPRSTATSRRSPTCAPAPPTGAR